MSGRLVVKFATALLLASSFEAPPAEARLLSAAERAAKRAVLRHAHAPRARPLAADRLVRRWTVSRCGATDRCPLPERYGATFTGGSYDEVRLSTDTRLYRVYATPDLRMGVPGERYSYWSRSDAVGSRAIIDSAIPTTANGNLATRRVSIIVPRGTTVYEGTARGLPRGAVGGGSQVIVRDVRLEWVARP